MIKIKSLSFIILLFSILFWCFSSCEREPVSENVTGIEIRMRNADNGRDLITLLRVDSVCYNSYYQFWNQSSVTLGITKSNNFSISSSFGPDAWTDCEIVSVGSISNLGQIKNIPSSGWTNQDLSVKPGFGYIIRSKTPKDEIDYKHYCRYARVYVVSWIEAVGGGIIGAVIRYEDNWKIED